ncbi:hisD, histidinol dehydrogenase, partial [Fragilariopsis cylindrus CCMP1102]
MLQPLSPSEVSLELKDPVNPKALEQAKDILKELTNNEQEGTVNPSNLLKVAQRLGDVDSTICTTPQDLIVSKSACKEAFDSLTDIERTALTNMYHRIKAFAELQRLSVKDTEMSIPGGKAGHTVSPCRAAGCYAPGGRYPLPSSVLMTCCTARAAGCPIVILASPKPAPITLAAAYIAGADIFVRVGGAQAIATMAYGLTIENTNTTSSITIPPCDVICGPGNQWVTAAKSIVQGKCGIDMLAGPSEVLVICDDTASPSIVAADLIAQAEHDVVARAILLTTSSTMIDQVNIEISKQVNELPEPNRSTAISALKNGSFSVLCRDMQECITISDNIAPEHLEIQTSDSQDIANQCTNYGGLFIGVGAAEVLGDYGAGPNHTLPTGGTGRYTGGLSVFNFLR